MNYSTNKERIRIIILALNVIVFIVISYFIKNHLKQFIEQGFLVYIIFTFIAFFFGLFSIYFLISKFFFKIPYINNTIPNFNGNWQGKGKSLFNNNEFDVKIKIKQTLTNISVNAYFNKSKSEAKSVYVQRDNDKEKLYYIYFNEPKNTEENLDCHYGTMILEKIDDNMLEGNYFTSRKPQTKGTFTLKKADNETN